MNLNIIYNRIINKELETINNSTKQCKKEGCVMTTRKLYKSRDKKVCGVCGGIAEYFGIDPTIVRLIYALLVFCAGVSILPYIVAAILMEDEPMIARESNDRSFSSENRYSANNYSNNSYSANNSSAESTNETGVPVGFKVEEATNGSVKGFTL